LALAPDVSDTALAEGIAFITDSPTYPVFAKLPLVEPTKPFPVGLNATLVVVIAPRVPEKDGSVPAPPETNGWPLEPSEAKTCTGPVAVVPAQ